MEARVSIPGLLLINPLSRGTQVIKVDLAFASVSFLFFLISHSIKRVRHTLVITAATLALSWRQDKQLCSVQLPFGMPCVFVTQDGDSVD